MWFIKHIKTGEILNINQEKTTIGRLGTTYVLKNDESISRKHCTFLLSQNELKIIDDGAKYGTTIKNSSANKVSKDPMTLKDGDKVHFGCFENIWEVHCKQESRGGIKRKTNDEEAVENRNHSKILKTDLISAVSSQNSSHYKQETRVGIKKTSDEEVVKNRNHSNILKTDRIPANSSQNSSHYKQETRGGIKRKTNDEEAVENRNHSKILKIDRNPAVSSQNSRKRELDDEIFNFDVFNKHQLKGAKKVKKNDDDNDTVLAVPSTSAAEAKSFAFKTTKLTDKEVFASVSYDINEDSNSWLSTRVSRIKVKDETHDETDNSMHHNSDPQYSINLNIVRKNISLDKAGESTKSFHKQKFKETTEVVTLKKLNVKDMNYCYNKKEESNIGWS